MQECARHSCSDGDAVLAVCTASVSSFTAMHAGQRTSSLEYTITQYFKEYKNHNYNTK